MSAYCVTHIQCICFLKHFKRRLNGSFYINIYYLTVYFALLVHYSECWYINGSWIIAKHSVCKNINEDQCNRAELNVSHCCLIILSFLFIPIKLEYQDIKDS